MKKTLTQKQIAEYEQLCYDRDHGRLLTPDGLRLICAAHEYNAEAIGKHFLELLPKICCQGEPQGGGGGPDKIKQNKIFV